MGKFKISLEFKLNIEGEREDVPEIVSSLQKQIGSALAPSAQIAAGGRIIDAQQPDTPALAKKEAPRKARRPRTAGQAEKTEGSDGEKVVQHMWVHDREAWGFPLQTWNHRDKSIWLFHVAAAAANVAEMTPSEIANTFNSLFKETGQIRPSNISRDLNIARSATPALISYDLTTSKIFLTTAGKIAADQLCREAKGQETATSS